MSGLAYARLVPKLHRSRKLPKIDRPWRPRMIAWAGPSAFYPNRFYEQDKWYKARIDKPEKIQKLYIINPNDHRYSLAEFFEREREKHEKINIGFQKKADKAEIEKSAEERAELEKKARKMELLINTDAVSATSSLDIYHHYGIFSDLFGKGAYFDSVQSFEVSYGDNAVYTGNTIAAEDTKQKPEVVVESIGGSGYNTLVMINLDGNPYDKEGEIVHWMVANIPDGKKVEDGIENIPYLPPLPFNGTGYHRVAFVLFRHQQPLETLPNVEESSLSSRVMSFAAFYKDNESIITPSGISFYQTSYDSSVKQTLHDIGMKSPIYEYEYNEALKPAQKEFPERPQPFDLYLDMYRDPKEVEAEMLEERLRRAQLNDYEAPKWRDLNYNENKRKLPEWQHRRMMSREGVYKAIYNKAISS